MGITWAQAARAVSEEWGIEGRMPIDPNGGSADGHDEIALWDEIERRVRDAGWVAAPSRAQRPEGPST